ncbi:leukotoxin LktA family filamentous adhesin [Rhodoferax sp. PAMC 29310]|uniref:leukotoxin LktA family filamentous adhesin n=1 Tax=Rhodoferax sp. PAMC 29310 TaxID=2822760 RepID=UPI001B31A98A|nr:leukotoxin LktA family filamentous adhesin [Rhodoferax sp. PAMC 29310]
MTLYTFKFPSSAKAARLTRRRLVVRVRSVALAAAVALGAVSPALLAQTVITPLVGPGQTATLVSTQGNQTVVSTQSLRDGNAFSTYSAFQVGQGDVVKLAVPQGANWWVNIVRDARVRVDGRLESRLSNGAIGGNILFVDSHGFTVGPSGQVDVGRLSFAAPSTTFVNGLLAGGGTLSGAAVIGLLGGAFERSATGGVDIQGRVTAKDGVSIMAGQGGPGGLGVTLSGQVVVQGRVAGSAVNLGDLKSLAPLEDRDGVIDITTPGSIKLDGVLISDSSLWRHAGAVRVVAGTDIAVGANAQVSASGAAGSGEAGGQVTLYAHGSASNAVGATLAARGDGFGAGGFIELSAAQTVQIGGLTLDASSDKGQAGLAYIDPEDLVVSGSLYTNGAALSLDATKTLTVNTAVTLNTRHVTSDGASASGVSAAATAIANDPLTPSMGNSGNITLTAPSITVATGAVLDASVVNTGGTTFAAGDISLIAKQSSNWATFVSLSDANASITVAGTLKGRDINLLSSIESKAVFGGAAGSLQQGIVDIGLSLAGSPAALTLAYVQATGNARVTLTDTADVLASRDLSITAKADRWAGAEQAVEGSAKANLGAGFARVKGTTAVDVQSGANLSADHDMSLLAASKTKVLMNSTAVGSTDAATGAANVASIIFAGSLSDVTTTVTVGSGAVLSSGNDLKLESYHSGQYSTAAEVKVYGSGTAGVVGALSLQKSDTRATLDGQATAQGEARLTAMNFVSKSAVSAKSQNTSENPPLIALPATLETSDAEAQKGLMDGFMKMAGAVATAQEASTGNTSSASTPKLRMAGALAWAESDHTTRATLGAGASLVATGNAIIDAQTLAGAVQGTAMAEATSKVSGADASATSLSVAFNYNKNNFDTQARVGSVATLKGLHVAVSANTDMPEFYTEGLPFAWDDPFKVYTNLVGGVNPFFEGFNTRVAAKSAAQNLAASGAVSLSFNTNNTVAWVDTGARLSTTTLSDASWSYHTKEVYFDSDIEPLLIGAKPYRLDKTIRVINEFASETREVLNANGTGTGVKLDEIDIGHNSAASLLVKAQNHAQTLHAAGGAAPESSASGTAVGGTFSMVERKNTAVSGIADQAVVNARSLSVQAINKDWLLSVAATAGAGEGVAANAMMSYDKLTETALASISREAQVTVAKDIEVKAALTLWTYGISGAVTKSSNSGVGIGLAMNEITGNTKAYIGDNDSDAGGADTAEGAVGFVQSAQLAVLATTTGQIGAVGVAGAMAGGTPKPGLADKAGTKSAGAQSQLDGSDASMAPAAEAGAPAEGSGTGQAAAAAPAASKPPSFSIAGAGAIVTNYSNLDTTALIDRAVISAIGSGTNTVAVRALSDVTQVSAAGGGALSMSKSPATTFTAAVAGAVAIQDSDDDTTARIVGSTISDLADQAGGLVVQALKSGERTAVATGISANLSKGSTTSVSVVGAASVTTTTDDTVASMEGTTVSGNIAGPTALGVQVVAYDRSRIGAGGGALSVSTGKGSAGVGAAISIVNANGSTQAQVSGGSIRQVHDLAVLALSSQKVVGVGAVAGLQTSSDSTSAGQLMGSFVFNHVGNTLSAGVKDDAEVNLTGDLAVQAGGAPTGASLDALLGAVRASGMIDYEMTSASNGYTSEFKNAVGGESVVGVAGTLSVTLGGNASSLGLSYVQNDIQTTYGAELNGRITTAGAVSVQALSRADIVGVSAGVGATKGKFSGMGSAAVNLIGQRTQALVTGGTVTAASLAVKSDTTGNTFGLAGNLSFAVGGGNGKAMGAAVAYTQTGTKTYTVGTDTFSTRAAGNAATINNTKVNVGAGTVQVQASNTSDLMSVAASGAAADGNVGFAGTVTVNETGDVTEARISASTVTAGAVQVQAGEGAGANSASIRSLAGGVSASKGYSGALALGFNTINSTRSAQILSSTLHVGSAVSVLADSDASIQTLSVTLAGGKDYALAGSSSTNVLNGTTLANVEYSTIDGAASSLTVHASQAGSIQSLAGAVAAGGTGAIGGAVAVNLMGQGSADFKVTARLKDSVLAAPVAVSLDALLDGSIGSVAASGSGAGTTAINGSVTSNVIEANVLAEVVGGSQSTSGGAFKVHADNDAAIASLAGTISGAGTTAVGAAVSVNEIGGSVTARVQNFTMRATGAVEVDATSSGSIGSIAAGVSGAGTTALAGSNTTNAITSTVLAQMDSVTQAVASASLRLQAKDSSIIQSFAGSVAGGGTAAGGAAFALNFLGRTALNADSSKIVKAEVLNSTINSGGAVLVKALSTSLIESMGVAVGASGNVAVTGSNTTNLLEDEITASWSGGSLSGTATSLTVQADDAATVRTLAGNFSASGAAAVGAAIAVNQIGSAVQASLSGMTLSAAPTVVVDADLRGEIKSVAASGAASGSVSVNGSFTTNEITASVKAQALGLTQSTSGGAFTVSADNDADIFSLAGTISAGGTAAVGVAVSVNDIGGDVTARLANSTLRATGAVNVLATTSGTIESIAAGMAGGGTVGAAGSNTTNSITSTVLAQMDSVTQAAASGSLLVQAKDSSTIQSFAGSVAGGGTAAGGAAFALNFLGRTALNADSSKVVKAEVLNSAINSGGAVQVKALSTSLIESMGVAVGASGNVAVTGSNTTNLLEDEITASWSGGSLSGTATSLTVQADDAATVRTLAGNFSASGAAAVGAAIAVNQIGSAVLANLSGMTLHAAPTVVVDADLRGEIKSVAASGSVSAGASVNGSFTTNSVSASVKAQVLNLTQVTNGGAFTVSADNDADIFSLAGTISGGGAAAVGVAVSVNDIGGDVTARLADSALQATGAVNVKATTSGSIESIAAGMAVGGTVTLAGSFTTNGITSTVLAQMAGVDLVVNAATLTVEARDTSTIKSFAGTVTGGGTAGGGAALALNFLGRTALDADSSKVVKAEVQGSVVRSGGMVAVNAYSTSTIKSIGVAAGVGGASAINGSNATNLLEDEVTASWVGSELIASNTLSVSARQAAEIDSLAGNLSGSGGVAVGAALAVNRIGTQTRASLVGVSNANFNNGIGHWTQNADDLLLSAESDNQINTVAVGMSAGSVGVQGSVAVSLIASQTHATLGADGFVTKVIAADSVAVTANSRDRIKALSGAVGLGMAGVGAAGGVLTNIISSFTTAGITGSNSHVNALANGAGLTVRADGLASAPDLMNITELSDAVLAGASFATRIVKGLAVQATSIEQIGSLTAVAGGGAAGAAGAAVNVDKIGGSTRAYIDSAFIGWLGGANAAQTTDVMAANHAMVASSATALAVGGVGVSGAVGTALIDRTTLAEVRDSAYVKAAGAVVVKARSSNSVAQIVIGAAGGAVAGVAGSGGVALVEGETVARVDSSTIEAGSVSVLADGANRINLIAGSAGVSAALGVGLSFTTNVSGSVVRALLTDSLIRADGAVLVHADNTTEELAVAATVGGGGIAGVAIGAAVTVLQGQTEANLGGTSRVERRTRATGAVASLNNAGVTVVLDGVDGIITANEQGATRFVLMSPATPATSTEQAIPAAQASLGSRALMKVSDGTRTVTATLNADGSYTANLTSLGDGQLTALIYTATTSGVPDAGSPSSRLLFTKAAGVGSLSVAANEHISINHNAGGVGVAGVTGVGSAANVVIGRSSVLANASGSALTVGGELSVLAAREANVQMITATAGGGGTVGVSGAVGVLLFGSAPDSNATSELNNGSGSSVARVSSATKANKAEGTGSALTSTEQGNLNSGTSYDTQAAFTGASGLHSTSATVAASSILAGSVRVSSTDSTEVNNSAGAIARGGAAGVSAGVAVTILGGANNASVSAASLDSQGAISVDSGTRAPAAGGASVQSRAIAGAGGFVGVGAAVSVARNQTANSAALSGGVRADGAVTVRALDQASMSSEAYGATVGALSVGVVVATADQSGSVITQVAGSVAGQGVSLSAERQSSVTAMAVGGSGGVVAGSGAGATASDSGTVQVNLASALVLDAGDAALAISAKASPQASSDAIGVAVGLGGAVGISVAESSVASAVSVNSLGALTLRGNSVTVRAVLGAGDSLVDSFSSAGAGGLLIGATGASASSSNRGSASVNLAQATALRATGDASFTATDVMVVKSNAVGIAAGLVGVGVALSSSESNSTVGAKVSNLVGSVGGSLQVGASGNESIDSDATAGAGGLVAGSGAESTLTHSQSVNAELGGDLLVAGMTTVGASRAVRYDSHSIAVNASAIGASGAVARATLNGSASAALLNATQLVSNSLRVLATNDLARTDLGRQSAEGGGGGVISGAGADVRTVLSGSANASLGNNVTVTVEKLLELRAYNEIHGSALGRMDVGGVIPIALVETRITSNANADASIGTNSTIASYGEAHVDALSYIDLEANTISKTYGLAAAAQGNAYATANVNNRVNLGAGTSVRSSEDLSLLAGQDRDFNRNKSFVTARADLFNHAVVPVSINPTADATLNLNNAVTVDATAVRSGGTIRVGAVEGSLVVSGTGNVSDWTRDLGEMMGISSTYGRSIKSLSNTAVLKGAFEAGFGNKQRLVIDINGKVVESVGDVRYSITNEDLSASASAYVARLYDQLARYGDVPEVKAFVQAELSFYFANLIKEGLAEVLPNGLIVPLEGVAANFLNIKDLRAGSGNIELFGNNVSGTASLTARADSEIYIENKSPLNLRVFNMTVDANGGFAKYNGTYLTSNADIGTLNTSVKTTGLNVDSIDTRGGGTAQKLPSLTVKNTYVPLGVSATAVVMTAPDGSSADLREDQLRAPELRVNGTLYNKLGTVNLANTEGSISVYAENPAYTPRLDGKEITVTAGKNFVLSSPTISQSVGGSPESLYAVAYSDDQQRILDNLGITACGSARPGVAGSTYNANCVVNGAGGVYASGAIFIGARYLNINGTVQSGQPDYNVVLSSATVGPAINAWQTLWNANRGRYLSRGTSSLIQVTGPRPTDSEAEINKQFANGTLTASQRTTALNAMAARRLQPIVFFDAETKRLKVAATNVTGGLVELIGTIINTGGGVVRALDGYAHINIDNQTSYGLDLLGLSTGGEAGVVRITDMGKPVRNSANVIIDYQTTTYQHDADGVIRGTVTAGRGIGDTKIGTATVSSLAPSGSLKAQFSYNPATNSIYSWSAGYEYTTEKHYYYQNSSYLGFISGGTVSWNNVDTYVKTANAMVEDVFVSTKVPVGGSTFSLQSKRFLTEAEVETYYRSWKKCGFLCIKKTYYVDRRTEVGYKDVFTQHVAADHPISIQLVGYNSGLLDVKSVGGIRLGGDITNASGTVSLTSTAGSISQLNSGAVVNGQGLSFVAKTGIGSQSDPINLITGAGSFTAVSTSGDIAVHGNSGALRVNRVSTTGNVWLDGDGSIFGLDPSAVHVSGNRIYLSAPTGGIGEFNADGTVKSTLNIQTADSTNGGLSAYARNGIAIKQPTGNLWVNQVASGGDVYLQSGGDLIDNNRNETRDERTEAQLLSLWDQAALQGNSAELSRQQTLTTTRAQYQRYWSLRGVSSVVTNGSGNVTSYVAPVIDPLTYQYHFSTEERASYLSKGITEAQVVAIETARTAEVLQLHVQFATTVYQTGNDQIIAAVNAANALVGKAEVGALAVWSDTELKSPLPAAVFSKSSTDTQTRIEEPNVVGNRVVLRPGGKVGRDDGSQSIPLLQAQRLSAGLPAALTDAERLVIMSAESADMTLNRANWTLSVLKKDNFNVLSNRLNVVSNGFIYLGADATAAYPNGGTANLEKVIGTGEVRIQVMGSILNVADAGVSVIQGQKAVLEAAQGSIGTALKPIQITLRNDLTGTLVARGSEGIWIHEIGDMRAADIFTPALASLSATGAIIDARPVINYPNSGDRTVRAIEANALTLTAQSGAIGSDSNPLVVKVGSGGVNATTPRGYSIYLNAALGASMTLKMVDSGLDLRALSATGNLYNLDAVNALGSIYATASGDISNVNYTAGSTIVIGAGGAVTGSQVDATGTVNVSAGEGVTLNSLSSKWSASVTAGGASSVKSAIAGADLSLVSTAGGFSGTAWMAGGSLLARAGGGAGDVSVISVAATKGSVDIYGEGRLVLDVASALGNVRLQAGRDMALLNVASRNGTLWLGAGGALSLLSGSAKGDVLLAAGAGVQALSLSSAAGLIDVAASAGNVSVQAASAKSGLSFEAVLGNLNLGALKTASGDLSLSSGAALQLTSASLPGNIVATAGTSADFGTLSSSTGRIALTANTGDLLVGKSTARTTFFADAKLGDLTLDSFKAASANLHAGGSLLATGSGATTGDIVIASGGDAVLASLTSTAGKVQADALGALTVASVRAVKIVDLSAGSSLTATTLVSSSANVDVGAASGTLQLGIVSAKTGLVANAVLGDATLGSFTAASANLHAGGSLQTTGTGTTSGNMAITSGGDAVLASLRSSAADINVASAGGSVVVKSANAKTAFAATSGGDLAVISYTVSAGGAVLQSGGATTLGTGVAKGNINVTSVGNAALGSLSTSNGKIEATSSGAGLTFAKLSAYNAIKLRAAQAWSSGNAISGTSLVVSNGAIDLLAYSGSMLISTLSATANSTLETKAGAINVGRILRLTPAQLLVSVSGGSKTLPRYY